MKGDAAILEALNACLTAELTAINQYFVHSKMCANWGYKRMAKVKHDESIEEMQHADKIIDRILYLDGVPNMQRLDPVRVGETMKEMHELDLQMEYENVARLNEAVALCQEKRDNGTRNLLEAILVDEEHAVDFLEGQLEQIQQMGYENYLTEQVREA